MSITHRPIVRKTRKEDLGAIMGMIQDLADFEKMPDGPRLTMKDLIRDGGFSDEIGGAATPVFLSFVLELSDQSEQEKEREALTSSVPSGDLSTRNKIVGYAICFYGYSTWEGKTFYLEDLYVKQDYRRKGYGEMLFKAVVAHAQLNGCTRVDFHVLGWNPAKKFYQQMGATNLTQSEEWEYFRLTKKQMDILCSPNSQ